MTVTLEAIARDLDGKIRRDKTGPHVVAPWPGCRKDDLSVSVWISRDGESIRVHSHRDVPWPEVQAYARRRCKLPDWKPKRKTPPKAKDVPLEERNAYISETRAICRNRKEVSFELFALLVNDLRLAGSNRILAYAKEFSFTTADVERCLLTTPRHYTADERAAIAQLTYDERQHHLGLRRTGSIDVDKAGRERLRRDRYNVKRRAARALARMPGVNKVSKFEERMSRGKVEDREERIDRIERSEMVESKIARVQNFGTTRESCDTSQVFRQNHAGRASDPHDGGKCEPWFACRPRWGSSCSQCDIPLDSTKRRYVVGKQMLCHECCKNHQGQGHDPPMCSPLPGSRPWRATREAPRQSERRSARSGVLLP
jgi:hypothetical protein